MNPEYYNQLFVCECNNVKNSDIELAILNASSNVELKTYLKNGFNLTITNEFYEQGLIYKLITIACASGEVDVAHLIYQRRKLVGVDIDVYSPKKYPKTLREFFIKVCLVQTRETIQIISWIYSYLMPDITIVSDGFVAACATGHFEIAKMLFPRSDPNHKNDYAFRWAIINKKKDIYRWLTSVAKINVSAENNHAFRLCCRKNNVEEVKFLLDLGVDGRNFENIDGSNIYRISIIKQLYETYDGIDITSNSSRRFYMASEDKDLDSLKWYSANGNNIIPCLNECIVAACKNPTNIDIVKWLYLQNSEISTEILQKCFCTVSKSTRKSVKKNRLHFPRAPKLELSIGIGWNPVNIDVLEFLYTKSNFTNQNHFLVCFKNCCDVMDVNVLKWLISHSSEINQETFEEFFLFASAQFCEDDYQKFLDLFCSYLNQDIFDKVVKLCFSLHKANILKILKRVDFDIDCSTAVDYMSKNSIDTLIYLWDIEKNNIYTCMKIATNIILKNNFSVDAPSLENAFACFCVYDDVKMATKICVQGYVPTNKDFIFAYKMNSISIIKFWIELDNDLDKLLKIFCDVKKTIKPNFVDLFYNTIFTRYQSLLTKEQYDSIFYSCCMLKDLDKIIDLCDNGYVPNDKYFIDVCELCFRGCPKYMSEYSYVKVIEWWLKSNNKISLSVLTKGFNILLNRGYLDTAKLILDTSYIPLFEYSTSASYSKLITCECSRKLLYEVGWDSSSFNYHIFKTVKVLDERVIEVLCKYNKIFFLTKLRRKFPFFRFEHDKKTVTNWWICKPVKSAAKI